MEMKVVRIPINSMTRMKNKLGKGAVPCQVSDRWLKFPAESAGHFGEGEFITLDVMTLDKNERPRKICELVVTREDLLSAINGVKDKDNV
ncbi:MAG: hypothetical protein A2X82_17660 [Geobacteraceae bacterium GWC2_55_20]|nr:MAG: hypothetical protein A2X82_17660 [Geobacteraceae bacterium GWC2_55_20]OGU22440.1 MAG: hypothetical protein A2X85_17580 [Geobacteraceae bacterium GWF2_54_21]HBA71222.1 hypothetical protein [Geobacter sp.]HCE69350.1 hypothetical protein [Geobacter sp.]